MTTDKVQVEISVDAANADKPVQSLKQQLREAVSEAQKLASADMGSNEAIAAQQKVANLKEEISDLNKRFEALNPEAKFKAFGQVAQGVAGGFAAAQGAAALFGAESEDLQKSLLKVQAALALSEGLNSIMALKDGLGNLALVVKTEVVAAFSSMKAALITSGIGALVILLGVVISKIIDYNDEIDAAATFQERYNKALKETNELLTAQADKSELVRNARKGNLDDLQNELKILEARGASEQTLSDKRDEILQKELSNLKIRLNTIYNDGITEVKIKKEIADKQVEIEANKVSSLRVLAAEEVELQRAKLNALDDSRNKDLLLEKLDYQASRDLAQDDKLKLQTIELNHQKKLADIKKEWDKKDFEREEQKRKDDRQVLLNEKEQLESWDKEKKELRDADTENDRQAKIQEITAAIENTKNKIELDKNLRDAKINLAQQTIGALQTLNQISGDNAEVNKALAIASATIDTYVGATKALAQGGVFGFISAAAIVVAGFSNVAKIAATPIPKVGQTRSSGGSSAPSTNTSAPTFTPQGTKTGQGQDITVGQSKENIPPQKVYVVESDIRNTTNRVNIIEKRSHL